MLRRLIASVAAYGALARAATGTSYSFQTNIACSTVSGTDGKVPLSLPTSSTSSTVTSTITDAEVTIPSTSRTTVGAVTTTVLTTTVWTWSETTITIPTSTSWVRADSVVATATWAVTLCTNGVAPSTVTQYSGIYTPIPGQVTQLPATYPSQVVCATGVTWFVHLQPTATSGVTTATVTPTSTVVAPTATSTSVYVASATVYGTTVTSMTTSLRLATSAATTSTACAPTTTTTTFAAKCAPTSVVAGVDGRGLVSGRYAANITVVYVPDERYEDPSVCCQLCQDNAGCAGMMAGISGFCGLYYIGGGADGPVCDGFTFTYQTQSDVFPGQGLWIQSGCGEVEYTGPDGV
ncbi:hypothetical protein AAE478_002913 [Parahypoxylon ruwenzoriense]